MIVAKGNSLVIALIRHIHLSPDFERGDASGPGLFDWLFPCDGTASELLARAIFACPSVSIACKPERTESDRRQGASLVHKRRRLLDMVRRLFHNYDTIHGDAR